MASTGNCVQGPDGEEPTQALVAIDSLGGRHMQFYLHKRPGFEREDVLEGDLDEREGEHLLLQGHTVAALDRNL